VPNDNTHEAVVKQGAQSILNFFDELRQRAPLGNPNGLNRR